MTCIHFDPKHTPAGHVPSGKDLETHDYHDLIDELADKVEFQPLAELTANMLIQGFANKSIDAVFVTGAAQKPVWLSIDGERIEFNDADALWGKDIIETEAAIREGLGDQKVQVACIGEGDSAAVSRARALASCWPGPVTNSRESKKGFSRWRMPSPSPRPPLRRVVRW